MISPTKIQTIVTLSLLTALVLSCDGFHEAIVPLDVQVEDVTEVLVINAEIEKDQPIWVQVSYSEDIDAVINTPIRFEKQASISLTTASGDSEILAYRRKGLYIGSQILGKVAESYTLSVEIGEMTYSASSTMLPPPGYQAGWLTTKDNKGVIGGYSDEWIVNDPSDQRNRYLFEWWTNGQHRVRRDWAIDDNRVVNANEGLRLFNVTTDPLENEYTVLRAAEVDKLTYDYFNMYEKIVRGLVGVASQTPYNPVSNFGPGTMGNFRSVAFSSLVLMTPPSIQAKRIDQGVEISFQMNSHFQTYNLYWQQNPGVNTKSDVLRDIAYTEKDELGVYIHKTKIKDTLYYRIESADHLGNVSVLSPEQNSASSGISEGDFNVTLTEEKGQITLSWDPVTKAIGYGVYWSLESGVSEKSSFLYNKDNAKATSYSHTGLKKGQRYFYRIVAFFEGKEAGKSTQLSEEVSGIPK